MEQLWTDLSETLEGYYASFLQVLPRLGFAIILLLFLILFSRAIQSLLRKQLTKRLDDQLLTGFISRTVKTVYWILGFILILHILNMTAIAGSLVAGAGISAIVLGFAFRDVGENFLAGIIMAFRNPFRQGDIIEINDVKGKVLQLNIRDTQVKTFDGKDVFIPNGLILKNPLFNYTIDGYLRYEFVVGLDYESDIGKAEKIIIEALKGVDGIIQDVKPPAVTVKELGASTINLDVYFWIDDFSSRRSILNIKIDAVERCLEALQAEGYYMPSDIIEIKNYNDIELKTKPHQQLAENSTQNDALKRT
ncbi:MAG: mechanosensitive ion channel family protein [Bacteroidota bacterium]